MAAAPLLGSLFAAMIILVLFYFTLNQVLPSRPILALIPALFLVTSPVFEFWAWSGLETALFTLLCLATFSVFYKTVRGAHSLFGAGLLFTLAALTRLDVLVLLPVYLIFIFYFNKEHIQLLPRKYLSFAIPLLLLVAHILWRYSYYNSWLPNTFYAKVGVPILSLLRSGLLYTSSFALSHAPYLLLLLLGGVIAKSERKQLDLWKLAVTIIVVWGAYVTWIGGDHFAMFRFYLPILPLIALLFAATLDNLVDKYAYLNRQRLPLALATIALLVCASNFVVYQRFDGYRAQGEVYLATAWSRVGQWLRQNVPAKSSLASLVVGAIPYYSGLRVCLTTHLTSETS